MRAVSISALATNRPFTVIASDQGFLPAPVAVQTLSLAPGERREVLVDMSQGDEVSITAGTAAGIMDRLRGLFEPSSILTNTLVLTLRPTGLLPLVTDNLPMRLLADQILMAWRCARVNSASATARQGLTVCCGT